MINKSMRKYRDILIESSQAALETFNKKQKISQIADILETSEKYLGRPLMESEIYAFTELLMEEEASNKDGKGPQPVFKKGTYKVEIITAQGKVVRKASSQKGLLDVIHSAKNFRVLDANNRDITSKVKSFVKEREKQAQLRKSLKKKKVNEERDILTEKLGGLGKKVAAGLLAAKSAIMPIVEPAVLSAEKTAPVLMQAEKGLLPAAAEASPTLRAQLSKLATEFRGIATQTSARASTPSSGTSSVSPLRTTTSTTTPPSVAPLKPTTSTTTPPSSRLSPQIGGSASSLRSSSTSTVSSVPERVPTFSSFAGAVNPISSSSPATSSSQIATHLGVFNPVTSRSQTQTSTTTSTTATSSNSTGKGNPPIRTRNDAVNQDDKSGVSPGFGIGNPSAILYNDTLETEAKIGVGGTIYYA